MNRLYLLLLSLAGLMISSCTYNIQPVEDLQVLHLAREYAPEYQSLHALSISNYYIKPTYIKNRYNGGWVGLDLKQYTDAIIILVKEGFAYSNIRVTSNSKKSIKIRVHNITFNRMNCVIKLSAELSDGRLIEFSYKSPFQHYALAVSGYRSDYVRQGEIKKSTVYTKRYIPFRAPLVEATSKLLNARDFVDFINK